MWNRGSLKNRMNFSLMMGNINMINIRDVKYGNDDFMTLFYGCVYVFR